MWSWNGRRRFAARSGSGIRVGRRLQPKRRAPLMVCVIGARKVYPAEIYTAFLASQHVVEPVVDDPIIAGRKRTAILQVNHYGHFRPCGRARGVHASVPIGIRLVRSRVVGCIGAALVRRLLRRRWGIVWVVTRTTRTIIRVVADARRICVGTGWIVVVAIRRPGK